MAKLIGRINKRCVYAWSRSANVTVATMLLPQRTSETRNRTNLRYGDATCILWLDCRYGGTPTSKLCYTPPGTNLMLEMITGRLGKVSFTSVCAAACNPSRVIARSHAEFALSLLLRFQADIDDTSQNVEFPELDKSCAVDENLDCGDWLFAILSAFLFYWTVLPDLEQSPVAHVTSCMDATLTTIPLFSIVIGVYNDWEPLGRCLESLARQVNEPVFEVIAVDDGSKEAAPAFIHRHGNSFRLTLVRQAHLGIVAARNRGAQMSRGSVLVFADADCNFQPDCLANLETTLIQSPQHSCFQLHLVGDCSGIVGRAEELRLITLQTHLLQPDGRIRYLNTAGFAIRRARVNVADGVFDPGAVRAEDTLLLATLIKAGELPLYVPDATVQHAIPLTLLECFHKDMLSAHLDARAYDIIAAKGVTLRVSQWERLHMLVSMWKTSGQHRIGRWAWFVVVARQAPRTLVLLLRKVAPRVFRGRVPPNRRQTKIHN